MCCRGSALAAERDINPPLTEDANLEAHAAAAVAHAMFADVRRLRAAALVNLSPWKYCEGPFGDRRPREGTEAIAALLERTLEDAPNHPGACHYFIHLMEAAFPERAVGCAERLADLMPGAGYIVHMPGHIYIRVGRYADGVRQDELL